MRSLALTVVALMCTEYCVAAGVQPTTPSPLTTTTAKLPAWQLKVWKNVDVYGRFISGSDLAASPLFKSLAPVDLLEEASREEIYLLTVCRPKANPGKRVLGVKAEVKINDHYVHEFSLIPDGKGFLTRGQTFSLVKVVSSDWLLPDGTRAKLLGSKPELKVTRIRAK